MKKYSILLIPLGYLWLIWAAISPVLPGPKQPVLFFSNQCQQDLKLIYYRTLQKAQKSISLSIYALTDPDILTLLQQKGREGVHIDIFFDPKASLNIAKKLEGCATLQAKKGSGLMHRKILIVDEELVLIGSANLTTQSLRMHDNLLLGFFHPALADWLKTSSAGHFSFAMEGQEGEMWLLPDKGGVALQRLLKEINAAQHSLYLSFFTLTHPELVDALIRARQRGVDVRVAIDYYAAKGASRKSLEKMQKEGEIPLFPSLGLQLLHHKWVWIDEKTLICGSANWTKAAFNRNQDCFIIINPLTKEQKKFLHKLWNIIELAK